MPVMLQMTWNGIGAEDYEAARKHVNWEGDAPPGAMFHVMAVTDDGVRVTDVWESAEAFDVFGRDQLTPGVKELGIPGEPQVAILPAHAVVAPGYDRA
jgi:hypothetical protein